LIVSPADDFTLQLLLWTMEQCEHIYQCQRHTNICLPLFIQQA